MKAKMKPLPMKPLPFRPKPAPLPQLEQDREFNLQRGAIAVERALQKLEHNPSQERVHHGVQPIGVKEYAAHSDAMYKRDRVWMGLDPATNMPAPPEKFEECKARWKKNFEIFKAQKLGLSNPPRQKVKIKVRK